MARTRCYLYHSLRLSRDGRWADAYRAGRPGHGASATERGAGRERRRGVGSGREATVIDLADRRDSAR